MAYLVLDGKPNIEEIRKLAQFRDKIHESHNDAHWNINKDSHFFGLIGEAQFSIEFNTSVDTERRDGGDGGIDFTFPSCTVDVKTVTKPSFDCWLHQNTFCCQFIESVWYHDMLKAPIKRYHEKGPLSHYKHQNSLRPMFQLKYLCDRELVNREFKCRKCSSYEFYRIKTYNVPENPLAYSVRLDCSKCNAFNKFEEWQVTGS